MEIESAIISRIRILPLHHDVIEGDFNLMGDDSIPLELGFVE